MLMAGKNVTVAGDQLHALSLERMYLGLTQPKGNLIDLLQQLRSLKSIDPNGYRRAKTQLPYVVCGNFSPALRRKENFAWTEHFIIDIDHLASINLTPNEIKNILKQDNRIALLFTSPGNDGVKLIFNLQDRIHDAGYYSAFYKLFAAKFAVQYQLEGAVDLVTSDVSRCCFMSYDPGVVFNANAETIDANSYLDQNNLEGINAANALVKNVEQTSNDIKAISGTTEIEGQGQALPDDVLWKIKQKLNPALAGRGPKTKEFIQPQALTDAMPALNLALLEIGITLVETTMIHYGRQLKLCAGNYWAEVNLFHGKQGFKAVQTTKTGSNKNLAEMATQAIQLHFDNPVNNVFFKVSSGEGK